MFVGYFFANRTIRLLSISLLELQNFEVHIHKFCKSFKLLLIIVAGSLCYVFFIFLLCIFNGSLKRLRSACMHKFFMQFDKLVYVAPLISAIVLNRSQFMKNNVIPVFKNYLQVPIILNNLRCMIFICKYNVPRWFNSIDYHKLSNNNILHLFKYYYYLIKYITPSYFKKYIIQIVSSHYYQSALGSITGYLVVFCVLNECLLPVNIIINIIFNYWDPYIFSNVTPINSWLHYISLVMELYNILYLPGSCWVAYTKCRTTSVILIMYVSYQPILLLSILLLNWRIISLKINCISLYKYMLFCIYKTYFNANLKPKRDINNGF